MELVASHQREFPMSVITLKVILLTLCILGFGIGCTPDRDPPALPQDRPNTLDVPIISRSGPLGMGIDRSINTPLTARGKCIDLIGSCINTTDETQDHCINQLRRCQSSHPWDESVSCCPSACIDTYLRERGNGVDPRQADDTAFYQRGCYPGVDQMIRGEPWR